MSNERPPGGPRTFEHLFHGPECSKHARTALRLNLVGLLDLTAEMEDLQARIAAEDLAILDLKAEVRDIEQEHHRRLCECFERYGRTLVVFAGNALDFGTQPPRVDRRIRDLLAVVEDHIELGSIRDLMPALADLATAMDEDLDWRGTEPKEVDVEAKPAGPMDPEKLREAIRVPRISVRTLVRAAQADAERRGEIVAVFLELDPSEWEEKLRLLLAPHV